MKTKHTGFYIVRGFNCWGSGVNVATALIRAKEHSPKRDPQDTDFQIDHLDCSPDEVEIDDLGTLTFPKGATLTRIKDKGEYLY